MTMPEIPHLTRPAAPPLYAQDGKGRNAIVYAHYFIGANDWLITEYDPGEDIGFGWVCLNGDHSSAELGYISLSELESIRIPPVGLVVEHDESWEPKTLDEAIAELKHE